MNDPQFYAKTLEVFVILACIGAAIGLACVGARLHRNWIDKRFPPLINAEPAPEGSEHLMDYTYAQPPMAESADSTHPCFKPQIELIRSDKVKP